MYERLVVGKHWLSRIHCSIARVKELFLKRWKENDWDEQDDRDDTEFLEAEKNIWKEMFPTCVDLLYDEEEEEPEEGNVDENEEEDEDNDIIEEDSDSSHDSDSSE